MGHLIHIQWMNGQDGKIGIHIQGIGMDWMAHFTQHPLHPTKYLHFRRSGFRWDYIQSHHRTLYVFTNYLWNRNILRDHRSPKIFSTEELPFIERRWVSVYQVHASLGSCKKHLENFPQYVWNKGITWIYFSYKRGGILCLSPPLQNGKQILPS